MSTTEAGGDIGLVVAACNMAGYALKKSPAPDWLIPFALPIIGAALYCGITEQRKPLWLRPDPAVTRLGPDFIWRKPWRNAERCRSDHPSLPRLKRTRQSSQASRSMNQPVLCG